MTVAAESEPLPAFWLRGAQLMHQQCWCWGQDVRRSDGNLLLEYGFERSRPAAEVPGSSRYLLGRDEARIVLWGFGAGYVAEGLGGIYVNRYCFVPRWMGEFAPIESVWCAEELASLRRPFTRCEIRRSRRLLQSLMRWIAGYEEWVERKCGNEYRGRTLKGWNRTSIPANQMATEWRLLARHVEEPPPERHI
ncbi:MAG: hypothetical protein FJW30_13560 [Acidobacteria bacterium]|nr:hypothetical protein [Acidobacteriota bacterium]